MTYATLVIGRRKFDAVTVKTANGRKHLAKDAAEDHWRSQHEAEMAQHDVALTTYEEAVAAAERARREFLATTRVEQREVRRDTGGLLKQRITIDEVWIGNEFKEMAAGTGDAFLTAQAERRFPKPSKPTLPAGSQKFVDWWNANKKEVRTWAAQLITADQVLDIDLGDALDWSWGYPAQAAVQQLNNLQADGWLLVHTSEDHGLYTGEDANFEAYPARTRYLLVKP